MQAPGHWNDPDMLEVGNGGMTDTEYRTHMSLWAILAAPLLAGNDLSKMTPETKAILLNKEVIAVDQDKLGKQGDRAMAWGMTEIWTKPLSGGALAAGLFNRDTEAHSVTLHLQDIGFAVRCKAARPVGAQRCFRDRWILHGHGAGAWRGAAEGKPLDSMHEEPGLAGRGGICAAPATCRPRLPMGGGYNKRCEADAPGR